MATKRLTKSMIAEGITCEKKAYLSAHKPNLKSPTTPSQKARFEIGNQVGVLARSTFPDGLLIDRKPWEYEESIDETKDALAGGNNTIFEAAFGNEHFYCRLDVLHRESNDKKWKVYEVKSGLDPKPEYILDLAIQCWILNQLKVGWEKAYIIHLNRDCIFPDLSTLFIRSDVTDAVNTILVDIGTDINSLMNLMIQTEMPSKNIGRYCEKPYVCGFKAHCWKHIPDYSIFDLPNGWRLFDKGKLKLEDLTIKDLTPTQRLPFDVATKNYVHIDRKGIEKDISAWIFPMYHLDFETIGPAIPRYGGTWPYLNVPFQFSLHIQIDLNSKLKHFEYLHEDSSDPRRAIAEKLVHWIPIKGGIVPAYNASFEEGVIRKLAERFKDLSSHLTSIADRLIDPQPVIKANVYHKEFKGSFSLKEVAPALLGQEWNYSNLDVSDGTLAQLAYEKFLDSSTDASTKAILKIQLLKYCSQDTLAMANLILWLYKHKK